MFTYCREMLYKNAIQESADIIFKRPCLFSSLFSNITILSEVILSS